MPAWYIYPVQHYMPQPRLPRPGIYIFRVRLCSAFCTQQQSIHFYLIFSFIFIFCRVASGARQVNRTDDRFALLLRQRETLFVTPQPTKLPKGGQLLGPKARSLAKTPSISYILDSFRELCKPLLFPFARENRASLRHTSIVRLTSQYDDDPDYLGPRTSLILQKSLYSRPFRPFSTAQESLTYLTAWEPSRSLAFGLDYMRSDITTYNYYCPATTTCNYYHPATTVFTRLQLLATTVAWLRLYSPGYNYLRLYSPRPPRSFRLSYLPGRLTVPSARKHYRLHSPGYNYLRLLSPGSTVDYIRPATTTFARLQLLSPDRLGASTSTINYEPSYLATSLLDPTEGPSLQT